MKTTPSPLFIAVLPKTVLIMKFTNMHVLGQKFQPTRTIMEEPTPLSCAHLGRHLLRFSSYNTKSVNKNSQNGGGGAHGSPTIVPVCREFLKNGSYIEP